VLDPVNRDQIDTGLKNGINQFVGGNCTFSLMLLGLGGLIRNGLVAWGTDMTDHAASGGVARHMPELLEGFGILHNAVAEDLKYSSSAILDIDRKVIEAQRDGSMDVTEFGAPLAGSLIPWIDSDLGNGMSREDWKGMAETNKILGRSGDNVMPLESVTVRIGALRSHSQALTLKLTKDIPLDEIEDLLENDNDWVKFVPNTKEASVEQLTPVAVTGTMDVPVGRVRKL